MHLTPRHIFLSALGLLIAGCSSSPSADFDPFDTSDDDHPSPTRSASDEDPSSSPPSPQRPRSRQATMEEASTTPQRPIDGTAQGWDHIDLRSFDDERFLVDGRQHWQGPDHLSFHAAVDADESHFYIIVDVHTDDVDPSRDLLEFRLRDPGLDEMLSDLPDSLTDRLNLDHELTFAVAPDGRLTSLDGSDLSSGAIHTAGVNTVDGYRVEVAVGVDAFTYLRRLPLDAVGFRLDVLSDPLQMSASVRSDGRPRYALYEQASLLPSHAPEDAPPRDDALAVWHRDGHHWSFRSLEYLSSRWQHLGNPHHIVSSMVDADAFPASCDPGSQDVRLVDTYAHRDGDRRIALWLCGTPADDGPCPSSSTSDLIWSELVPRSSDEWGVNKAFSILDNPLEQCPITAPDDTPLASDFSLLPLDLIGPDVWAIGFHRRGDTSNHILRETVATLVDPHASNPILTRMTLDHVDATPNARTIESGRVFLTNLNDQEGLDICQIDEIKDQRCRDLMEDCETRDRAHELMTSAELWNPDTHQFEAYPLAQHSQCRGSTAFDSVDGYQLLIIDTRLGLIRAGR